MHEHTEITNTTEADVESVHNVLYETWLATYPNIENGITSEHIKEIIAPKLTEEEVKKRQEVIRNLPNDACSLVARMNGKIVGVCSGNKHGDIARLRSIYVLPAYQGKGVGGLLWEHFKKWAVARKVLVNVAAYNIQAINFYEKLGFVDTGKRFIEGRFTFADGAVIPQMEMQLDL